MNLRTSFFFLDFCNSPYQIILFYRNLHCHFQINRISFQRHWIYSIILTDFYFTHNRSNRHAIDFDCGKLFFLSLECLLAPAICQFILHNLWECFAYSCFYLICLDIMFIYGLRFCLQFNIPQGFVLINCNTGNRFCHISFRRYSHVIGSLFHFYRKAAIAFALSALIANTHLCSLNRLTIRIFNSARYCMNRYRLFFLEDLTLTLRQKVPIIFQRCSAKLRIRKMNGSRRTQTEAKLSIISHYFCQRKGILHIYRLRNIIYFNC